LLCDDIRAICSTTGRMLWTITAAQVRALRGRHEVEENGQSFTTGQWGPTYSYFDTLAVSSCTYYAARRSSSGESGIVQVTAAAFSSTPWHCFVK
jgi:hypothetical protein